jgi:hypothetical protein
MLDTMPGHCLCWCTPTRICLVNWSWFLWLPNASESAAWLRSATDMQSTMLLSLNDREIMPSISAVANSDACFGYQTRKLH